MVNNQRAMVPMVFMKWGPCFMKNQHSYGKSSINEMGHVPVRYVKQPEGMCVPKSFQDGREGKLLRSGSARFFQLVDRTTCLVKISYYYRNQMVTFSRCIIFLETKISCITPVHHSTPSKRSLHII